VRDRRWLSDRNGAAAASIGKGRPSSGSAPPSPIREKEDVAVPPPHSPIAIRLALPPAAAVLIVTVCSVAKRGR